MARRLGVCKIRHLDTRLLWVQGQVRSGEIALQKVLGSENPGDAMTMYLSGPDLKGHLQRLRLTFEEGRPKPAPQLTTAVSITLSQDKEVMRRERVELVAALHRSSRQDPLPQEGVAVEFSDALPASEGWRGGLQAMPAATGLRR